MEGKYQVGDHRSEQWGIWWERWGLWYADESIEVYMLGKPSTRLIRMEVQITINGGGYRCRCFIQEAKASPSIYSFVRTYMSEVLPVWGELQMNVCYGEWTHKLTQYVTRRDGPCLMGRDWHEGLLSVGIDEHNSNRTAAHLVEAVQWSFPGTIKFSRNNEVNQGKAQDPRPMPFALKGAVEQELNRLEEKGILWKVSHSDWAAPIVPVLKDDKVGICGDHWWSIPLPKPEDLWRPSLSWTYQQMELAEQNVSVSTLILAYNKICVYPFGVAYACLEKEALVLVCGIQHFYQYLYQRSFTLVSNHKPKTTTLNPRKGSHHWWQHVCNDGPSSCWLTNMKLSFKRTQENSNVDGLSWLLFPP